MPRQPTWLAVPLGYAACISWLVACSDPEPNIVARFPPDSALAGSGGGAGSEPAPPHIPVPRGRVQVVDGRLETDLGTPLRGLLLPVDTGWTLDDFDLLSSVATTSGLNALHVYLENSSLSAGDRVDRGDALVSLAAQAGLYLVLGFGTGTGIGTFNQAKLDAFWSFYSARYAANTHVLFEIQNNPEFSCDDPIKAATLEMERETYGKIRALAPSSHIVLFSTTSLVQPSVLSDAVARLGGDVDWGNASFALGFTADCLPLESFGEMSAAARAAGVPLLINQLPRDGWAPYLRRFEQERVGWFQFRWFANDKDLGSFRQAMADEGVAWCPERGMFPEDADVCNGP